MERLWSQIPIEECGEPLVQLTSAIFCLEPHPYLSLGAPYEKSTDPWRLRKGVFQKLLFAQAHLQEQNPELKLAIFDAWRPIKVQAFMVDNEINKMCALRGIDPKDPTDLSMLKEVVAEVNQFWAAPSLSEFTPPPHSTGGAVDLTISDLKGLPLNMGSKIDEIGLVSHPDYFFASSKTNFESGQWHQRRELLANVMLKCDFVQHPNEWWHFSYGDQLWAWESNSSKAIYGAWGGSESKSSTT